jgi:hypothetical protein
LLLGLVGCFLIPILAESSKLVLLLPILDLLCHYIYGRLTDK